MLGLDSLLGGLNSTFVFIVVLSILIVVHEWGHFITAKLCGIRVLEFALGFGPTLLEKEYNGTNYMLKAFPLGGFVRMAGDERDKCSGASDEFYSKTVGQRAAVIFNGPLINFVLAYVSFVVVFMLGYPGVSTKISEIIPDQAAYHAGLQVGDEIVAVNGKKLYGWMHYERYMEGTEAGPLEITVRRGDENISKVLQPTIDQKANLIGAQVSYRDIGVGFLPNVLGGVVEGYPAADAGLEVGDQVIAIDGQPIFNWTALQDRIANSIGETIAVKVLRDDQELAFDIKPMIETTKDEEGVEKEVRKIGVGPSQEFGSYQFGFMESFAYGWEELVAITVLTYKALGKMVTGSISAKKSVTGPVGIFYIVKGAAEQGLAHITFILGVISASLAIFNLLPILPLDGGHLFLLGCEKIRGKPLPEKVDEFFGRAGLTFILLLTVFIFYTDFDRFGIFDFFGKVFQKIINF